MKVQFLGAAGTTTGSMHLIEANGSTILLDCGLYQGKRKEAFERNRNLPVEAGSVDAVVLSHAHIDHSGNCPSLVKNGFEGRIHATDATTDLCRVMLRDSAYIQERDVEYANKKRKKQGKKLFEPLYTIEDAEATNEHFEPVSYGQTFEPAPGIRCAFFDAGHILGSAFTRIEISENGTTRTLFYSGDMGRKHMPILKDPVVVEGCEYLITESTYGNRFHPPVADVKAKLAGLINDIAASRGRLVIPAFSVGRTQQVLYFIHELLEERQIPQIPIFVDSPLSLAATEVFSKHTECYDKEMLELVHSSSEPFGFRGLQFTESADESKALNDREGPFVTISASGMCEAGRILHHLSNTMQDSRNIILIIGYQAEHTFGRRLVEREGPYRLFGEEHRLLARVEVINALSAHADRNEMLEYYGSIDTPFRKAFVVHGEADQSEPFAEALGELGIAEVEIPQPGDEFEL